MSKSFKNWLAFSIIISAIVFLFLSFQFYKITKKKEPVTTVSSCEDLVIDSIKAVSVRDTVVHYEKVINDLKKQIETKTETISSNKKAIVTLRRERDSVSIRLNGLREKYSTLRTKVGEDTPQNK
jgi:hypothetical protein